MSDLVKCQYAGLRLDGKNYIGWALDTVLHLKSMDLGNVVKEENKVSQQDQAKATIFIRHHIHEDLRNEYVDIESPLELWKNLKERFDHQKSISLPKATYDWSNLRLQDYKTISEYNSALFKIVSTLRLCGEKITDDNMLEKTYNTFHPSNMLLMQQYRERNFKKYSELISCLLVAEQNNELLLKNHQFRPTGSAPFPEVNVARYDDSRRGRGRRGRSRGRNNFQNRGRETKKFHQKWNKTETKQEKGKAPQNQPIKNYENVCYRCGAKGHWSRTCRTSKHLVDLYQTEIKGKQKTIESHLLNDSDPEDLPTLDVSDFLEKSNGSIDHFLDNGVGDGAV